MFVEFCPKSIKKSINASKMINQAFISEINLKVCVMAQIDRSLCQVTFLRFNNTFRAFRYEIYEMIITIYSLYSRKLK